MLIPFPFRFFLLNCLILISCFISPNIYAEINSAVLEELQNSNVVDQTNSLSRDEIAQLKNQNEQLYQQKHVDFKILMIPSTNGKAIDQYALEIFNKLKIGNEKLDNGLLLLVAKDDRKIRFEVGYGLEGDLTDIEAGRIIRHTLAPNFQNNDYFNGFKETQKKLLDKSITLGKPKNEDQKIDHILKTTAGIFLSFLLCIPLYWCYTKVIIKFGTNGALGAFIGLLIFEIFIHLLIFGYLNFEKIAFLLCASIPLYAPFMLTIFLPFNEQYRLLKTILYSLPLQIFALFGFGIFYFIEFYPQISFIILTTITTCFILLLLRYAVFLYRFRAGTENTYLTAFYNQYLQEKARQKMLDEQYERLNPFNRTNESSQSSSSSYSSSSSSSSSSSGSSSSSSSSSSRESGGSSGGGGASGSW
ncbi:MULTISPECIES: YgcG family protein [unclassified Acinetobacter]|uniref:TPM domain-containing protein n=1 Tax=unclassified Acinetobacter TaxID=196816 RepID=UPI0015D43D62|nr:MULTISPECIES: TPM domain-containing protein [unclassified Acinetobacter]UUS61410.1 TPM domain-containing protein [Acinetobacter sp. YH16056_T]